MGMSLTVLVPIGQYDPANLINPGLNLLVFKPELRISRRVCGNMSEPTKKVLNRPVAQLHHLPEL